MKNKINQTFLIMFSFFILMWGFYFIEQTVHFKIGIYPRKLYIEDIFGIPGVWLSHANFEHIENNSIIFFPILFFMCLIEKNIFKTLTFLILSSGLAIWILGEGNSFHIGASALVFASLGYILTSIFYKNFYYIIPVICALTYYGLNYFTNLLQGFIPQQGISLAGHLGGFISGIIVAFILHNKIRNKKASIV